MSKKGKKVRNKLVSTANKLSKLIKNWMDYRVDGFI